MGGYNKDFEEFFDQKYSDQIEQKSTDRDELTYIVNPDALLDILTFLKNEEKEFEYNFLTDLTATDWPEREKRHEVVYLLMSFNDYTRVRIKVRLEEGQRIPTATVLWDSANWLEREVWDLFGVEFEGHPDLTKILTPDDMEGHPLQRDHSLIYETPNFSWNKDDPPEVK